MIAVLGIGRVSGLIAALALAGSAQAQSSPLPAGVERAAHSYITRAALEAPIRFLSSDLLEGRGPATRGDELARLYLQTRLEGMGYQPTFAAGRIAADINIDGGNIFGRTRDATSIALGKSSLDELAARVAATQGRVVKGDQFPDRGYYYRSDQFSFARIGVPALFFDDGADFIGRPAGWGREQKEQRELKRYHQPSDRLEDSWNFDGMIEDAQLAMLSAWLTAQADAMPAWKPGDEFEAARKRALAAAGGS